MIGYQAPSRTVPESRIQVAFVLKRKAPNTMKYLLKYKQIEVGTVEGIEEDFLNLWGSFSKSESLRDEVLLKFICLSIRESSLIEEDHLRDTSEDLARLEADIEPFEHFVESED